MSTTLAAARAEVAKRASEFISGTATSGTTSTVVDTTNLNYADAYWAESTVLFTSLANAGTSRRVRSFDRATATLTLYGTVGTSASGAGYELYRRWTPADVDTSINRSINIAAPDFREKARAIATATAGTLQYTLPTGPAFATMGIVGVEYQYYTDSTQSTYPFTKLDPSQYEILEDFDGTNTVRTLQLRFLPTQNRLIRFVYDGNLGTVATGTDVIHLDLPELEWLYTQSVAELWRMESSRTTDAGRQSAIGELARWEANSDKLRRQIRPDRPPRPVRRTTFNVL